MHSLFLIQDEPTFAEDDAQYPQSFLFEQDLPSSPSQTFVGIMQSTLLTQSPFLQSLFLMHSAPAFLALS